MNTTQPTSRFKGYLKRSLSPAQLGFLRRTADRCSGIVAGVGRLARRVFGRSVPKGFKLVPESDTTLGSAWFPCYRDGIIVQQRPKYLEDEKFLAAVEHLLRHNAFPPYREMSDYPLHRLYLVWQFVQIFSGAEGDFVEFGTFRGGNAHMILTATATQTPLRSIYLYDTFAGIPADRLTDDERAQGFEGRYRETSAEFVEKVMLGGFANRVHLRAGLIPASLAAPGPDRIAFMHVDLNAAAPTLDALEWAYPRWSKGGTCILDDYMWKEYADQRRLVEDFFAAKGLEVMALPTGQGFVLNG